MRSIEVLKSRLEGEIIPRWRVHSGVENFARKRCVEHQRGIHSWYTGGNGVSWWEVGIQSKVTADVVGNRVCKPHILEATGGDLEVVIRVAPSPKTIVSGVRKHRRVIKVRGIWFPFRVAIQYSGREALPFVQSQ